ncbi:GATA zinc finger domain containing protein 1, partial [Operophtera brumata]
MPKPTCVQCSSNDSLLWRNQESGQICNECYLSSAASKELRTEIKSEDDRRDDEESAHSPAPYMQVGDIVSVLDVDGGTYYAQLRGFLTDQYCEKSAVLTWLLPTRASPPPDKCFDPATYIIGPEEELPRKLECMEWVMHAPADYYRAGCT